MKEKELFTLPKVAPGVVMILALLLPAPAFPQQKQPPISLVFNVHLDPVPGPHPELRRAELARRRDNMLWLLGYVQSLEASKRPRLNIQMSGDHAEFYLQDEQGLDMLRTFWKQGHQLGTHIHLNTYLGEFMRWGELRPSRFPPKPVLTPGDVLTPAAMPDTNSLEEIRKLWRDNFQFTDRLLAKVTGITDPKELRKINNHGEFMVPYTYEGKDVLFKEFGITVETGGRNEVFNMIYDHDVFNPWRPSAHHELKEDLSNRAYVCVPQLAVVGTIQEHFGVLQDLSVPAMQRRFLQIVMERREHDRLGLPPMVWTFGWTMHGFELYPEGTPGRPRSQRQNVSRLIAWINENFVPREARWKNPNDVANEFYAWETGHPGASSFQYPYRKLDWGSYPYLLRGATQALMHSHYVRALNDYRSQRVTMFELTRVKPGSEWFTDENNEVKVRGETSRLFLAWADGSPATLDLSKYAVGSLILVRGSSAERRTVKATAVPVGAEPVVIEELP